MRIDAHAQLLLAHDVDLGADGVHLELAAVGVDHRQRGRRALALAQVDRLPQLRELRVEVALERRQIGLLDRIVVGQRGDRVQARRDSVTALS